MPEKLALATQNTGAKGVLPPENLESRRANSSGCWNRRTCRKTVRLISPVRLCIQAVSPRPSSAAGYHHLYLEIAAKNKHYGHRRPGSSLRPEDTQDPRIWGLFLPLYALKSKQSWAAGDFGGLPATAGLDKMRAARWSAPLPLLPTFQEAPFDPTLTPGQPVYLERVLHRCAPRT
jgi:hypothetical protein